LTLVFGEQTRKVVLMVRNSDRYKELVTLPESNKKVTNEDHRTSHCALCRTHAWL